jgi:hypothetical protein
MSLEETLKANTEAILALTKAIIANETRGCAVEAKQAKPSKASVPDETDKTLAHAKKLQDAIRSGATTEAPSDSVALADLQGLAPRFIAAGKRESLVELLKSFKVGRISELPESVWTDFDTKAKDLLK